MFAIRTFQLLRPVSKARLFYSTPYMQAEKNSKSKKFRPNPRDDLPTQLSKTLAYVLRHGAEKEGIPIRPDGYVRVKDLLASSKLSALDFNTLQNIVNNDKKKRYNLLFEPLETDSSEDNVDSWVIRAAQGHSLAEIQIENQPILSAAEIPMAVHGSYLKAWPSISKIGISRMSRTHIHLSQGVDKDVVSGIRSNVQVLVYVDVQKAIDAGYKFEMSANGVILTRGNESGLIPPQFFERVERVITHIVREPMLEWLERDKTGNELLSTGEVEQQKLDLESAAHKGEEVQSSTI